VCIAFEKCWWKIPHAPLPSLIVSSCKDFTSLCEIYKYYIYNVKRNLPGCRSKLSAFGGGSQLIGQRQTDSGLSTPNDIIYSCYFLYTSLWSISWLTLVILLILLIMEDGDDSKMDEEKVPVKVGRGRSIQFLHLLACSLCLKLYAFINMQTLIYKLRIYGGVVKFLFRLRSERISLIRCSSVDCFLIQNVYFYVLNSVVLPCISYEWKLNINICKYGKHFGVSAES
jgi:hypothetical protein